MSAPLIVIVEADVLVRHPLAEFLRGCGYRVLEAADANEARQLLTERSGSVSLMLLDLAQLGSAGFELAGWARRNLPTLDIVMAGSAARTAEKAGELCRDGPDLTKPYDHRAVLALIKRLLAARDRDSP